MVATRPIGSSTVEHARRDRWLRGVLALVLAAPASGQSVHVVAGDGSGDFLQLQAAVTAAADGDVILVRPHTQRYDFTVINSKSLTIVGDGAVRPEVEDVRVINLPAGKVVTLRFLDIEAGWPALVTDDADCMVVVDSAFGGGPGCWSVGGTSDPGGDGGQLSRSRVALHGTTFVGGTGGLGVASTPGQGGIGLDSSASTLFTSGSSVAGGDTGADTGALPPQFPSATGLVAHDVSIVKHLATSFAAGEGPAPPGVPIEIEAASSIEDLRDAHRAIKLPAEPEAGKERIALARVLSRRIDGIRAGADTWTLTRDDGIDTMMRDDLAWRRGG